MPERDHVPVEQSTEVPTLPPETSPILPPPVPEVVRRDVDEAEETGTVENDEIEELIRPTPRPPSDPTKPPEPPTPPIVAKVTTSEPAPWLWWLTLGLCCTAIAVGVLYVVKARQREARGTDPGPGTPGAPSERRPER
jgi:hypothetical protein